MVCFFTQCAMVFDKYTLFRGYFQSLNLMAPTHTSSTNLEASLFPWPQLVDYQKRVVLIYGSDISAVLGDQLGNQFL